MFIHNSGKITFQRGYFLNHRSAAIEMDGADELTLNGTVIVDRTASDVNGPCNGDNRRGIIVHPVKQDRMNTTIMGTSLLNVDMLEFGNNRCPTWEGLPLQLGDSFMIDKPVFDIPTLFYNVSIDLAGQPPHVNPLIPIDGCLTLEETGIKDVSIEVANDVQGAFSDAAVDGFVVSPSIASLLDPSTCSDIQGCLMFCQGACLRTILFHTDATFDSVMVVKDAAHPERTYTFKSAVLMGLEFAYTSSYFGASLPGTSSYEVSFHDPVTSDLVFPSFVAPIYLNTPASCDSYAIDSNISVIKPLASRSACNNLIRNGSFDTGIDKYLSISTTPTWLATRGVSGTGALSYNHTAINSGVNQYIDLSCLVEGAVYEFAAAYRVLDATTGLNQDQTHCAGSSSVYCIHAWIEFRENDNSQLGDTVGSMRQTVGRAAPPLVAAGSTDFGVMSGTWTVTEAQASSRASRALLHFNNVRSGGAVIIDNISLTRVSSPARE